MKAVLSAAILGALLSSVAAFPRMDPAQVEALKQNAARKAAGCPYAAKREAESEAEARSDCPFGKNKKRATFNAQQQKVNVDGEHAWKAPDIAGGDQRGPCPGLNALANHNYLPRNGVADMATIIRATNEVYGMSLDLGGFLAVYGTVFDGNPLSTNPGYSIGGPSQYSQNILNGAGLLGTPSGLSGSHNKYETDTSATRGDLYVTGNNYHVQRDRFIEYYYAIPEDTPAPQQYTALAPFHKQRYEGSIATNSHFFYSPFAGVLVAPAAYSFPPRMMANHSEEYPEGYLSRQTFATFFGVEGNNENNFKVNQGWERIPDNWYKRPLGDDYSIPKFLVDVLEHAAYYPPLLSFGGNTGKVNSFSGVDISDLTGGVFRTADLLDPAKLQCFALQIIQPLAPDFLGSMFADVQSAMAPLSDKIVQLLAGKACPKLAKIDSSLFAKYPGFTESYGTYAGFSKGSLSGLTEGVSGVIGGLIPRKEDK